MTRLVCGPETFTLASAPTDALRVILYGQAGTPDQGSAGEAAKTVIQRRRLQPADRAWDLLSIALSVVTADFTGLRAQSPDGWTRELELDIAVAEPEFWTTQTATLTSLLSFLTTDRWVLQFHPGGLLPPPPRSPIWPPEDSVVLLSGGLDSLVGAIDLAARGAKPYAISQTVRGDAEKQTDFAAKIGGGLRHLQLNHNAETPGTDETSQRARSLIVARNGRPGRRQATHQDGAWPASTDRARAYFRTATVRAPVIRDALRWRDRS
jgi:hypothetical protein